MCGCGYSPSPISRCEIRSYSVDNIRPRLVDVAAALEAVLDVLPECFDDDDDDDAAADADDAAADDDGPVLSAHSVNVSESPADDAREAAYDAPSAASPSSATPHTDRLMRRRLPVGLSSSTDMEKMGSMLDKSSTDTAGTEA